MTSAYHVEWPLNRDHFLTMWPGYVPSIRRRSDRRPMKALFDVGFDYALWGRFEKGRCIRVYRVNSVMRQWAIDRIVYYMADTPAYASVIDKYGAACRVLATDVEFPIGYFAFEAYRAKHRWQATCRGEGSVRAKLTADQVRQIRDLYVGPKRPTQAALASQFGVSQGTICGIVAGDTWRYLDGPNDPMRQLGSIEMYEKLGVSPNLFDLFWAAYPRKVAKDDARSAFTRRHVDQALLRQMLDTLSWQVETPQWQSEGGQYIPYPATWLNQGRWQDEPMNIALPATRAIQVSDRELRDAERIRSNSYMGRCPHDPQHTSWRDCVAEIARNRRSA